MLKFKRILALSLVFITLLCSTCFALGFDEVAPTGTPEDNIFGYGLYESPKTHYMLPKTAAGTQTNYFFIYPISGENVCAVLFTVNLNSDSEMITPSWHLVCNLALKCYVDADTYNMDDIYDALCGGKQIQSFANWSDLETYGTPLKSIQFALNAGTYYSNEKSAYSNAGTWTTYPATKPLENPNYKNGEVVMATSTPDPASPGDEEESSGIGALFTDLKSFFKQFFIGIDDFFTAIKDIIVNYFTRVIDDMQTYFGAIGDFFSDIKTAIGNWFQKVIDDWKSYFEAIGDFFSKIWDWICKLGTTVFDFLKMIFIPSGETLANAFNNFKESFEAHHFVPDWLEGVFGAVFGDKEHPGLILGNGKAPVFEVDLSNFHGLFPSNHNTTPTFTNYSSTYLTIRNGKMELDFSFLDSWVIVVRGILSFFLVSKFILTIKMKWVDMFLGFGTDLVAIRGATLSTEGQYASYESSRLKNENFSDMYNEKYHSKSVSNEEKKGGGS